VLDEAQYLIDFSLKGFREAGVVRGELFALFIGGLTYAGNGDTAQGLSLIHECIALSKQRGEVFWRSYALWARAYLAVMTASDYELAVAAGREALHYKRQLDDQLGLAFAVDTLAWVAARQARHHRAAILFGAAASIWRSLGASPAYYPTFSGLHDKHVSLTRSALGDAAYDAAFQDGNGMTSEAALDFALGEGTAEERSEPSPAPARSTGSLTRRERQIAELIASGLTNREIAQQLVIAVRTAEGHVEHILSKLGFSSRAQVAAWLAEQRLREPGHAGTGAASAVNPLASEPA